MIRFSGGSVSASTIKDVEVFFVAAFLVISFRHSVSNFMPSAKVRILNEWIPVFLSVILIIALDV